MMILWIILRLRDDITHQQLSVALDSDGFRRPRRPSFHHHLHHPHGGPGKRSKCCTSTRGCSSAAKWTRTCESIRRWFFNASLIWPEKFSYFPILPEMRIFSKEHLESLSYFIFQHHPTSTCFARVSGNGAVGCSALHEHHPSRG